MHRLAGLLVMFVAAAAVAGCATDFTGGGTVPSADGNPADQANFGFTYKVTNTVTMAGQAQGTYHDVYAPDFPAGGVLLKFDGLMAGNTESGNGCLVNGIEGNLNYVSQNKAYPGSGVVFLAACDNGQPGVNNDQITVIVMSGPYAEGNDGMPYGNGQTLTGGNLKAH